MFPNNDFKTHLKEFSCYTGESLFSENKKMREEQLSLGKLTIPVFINEFWTSKQRQAHSLHEISYRACFKPQLPRFFIQRFTKPGDIVYDPFAGRGTTVIEAALMKRNVIANDINPLSKILYKPRFFLPEISDVEQRLNEISFEEHEVSDIDLSMFFHSKTLQEILSLRKYLFLKNKFSDEDFLDEWIQMVATSRLTGHSKGFFSVYTLPPNQAISAERQTKINIQRNQIPEYRNVKNIIVKKSNDLLRNISSEEKNILRRIARKAKFYSNDARCAKEIKNNSVQLTVTSPPFLDVVQYANDNWLRCWFNGFDVDNIGKKITVCKSLDEWCGVMKSVFKELFRITQQHGYVAFEVGEVRKGKIRLEENIAAIGIETGFLCEGIMLNTQQFTKTANIWGIANNSKGTNTNRIVIFQKAR
ncbi:MAG: site-specific DNA-methyltransferase [Ignavibacteria bacterium]|nr:site-specific DNA-methyltransferase [Ignavibacteria bacterium]